MQPTSVHGATTPRDTTICVGLFALGFALYARTLGFDFVLFDDPTVLLAHPNLYDETSLLASLGQIFIEYFPREEPLVVRDLTWAIDARLFGFHTPFGYHLGNVLLNATVVVLLFVFLRQMKLGRALAAGVALAFASLPVHVEATAWVMGRKDLLAAVWMLAALIAQGLELAAQSRARRRLAYVATIVFTFLAIGSKISAVVLFVLLFLHHVDHAHRREASPEGDSGWRFERAMFTRLVPHALGSIGLFVWYRGVLAEYGIFDHEAPSPFSVEHLATVLQFFPLVLADSLGRIFFPVELSAYYRWPHTSIPLAAGERILAWTCLCAVAGGVIYTLVRRRDLAFFALWPLVLLAPYCGLFYVGFWQADRYLYLASAGVLVLVAIGLRELVGRAPGALAAVTAVVLTFVASSAFASWSHQSVWRDGESLWRYEAYRREPSLLSIQGLAKIYVQRAENATEPEDRRAWGMAAAREVGRGFERFEALGLRASAYSTPEQLQLARLHSLRGRIAALAGAPAELQATHFRRSFEIAPDRSSALRLSRALFMQALRAPPDDRQRLVGESFDYFVAFVEMSAGDPRHLDESRRLLEENYEGRFPDLEARIDALRRVYFPSSMSVARAGGPKGRQAR